MITVNQKVNILGYIGKIEYDHGICVYYVYFGADHSDILLKLSKELGCSLDDIAIKYRFHVHCVNLFPEFYSLKDLEKFIILLNSRLLISII